MKNRREQLWELADRIGFALDEQDGVVRLFGERDGYHMILSTAVGRSPTLMLAVSQEGNLPSTAVLKALKKQYPRIFSTFTINTYKVAFSLRSAFGWDKTSEIISQAIDVLPEFLRANGLENCCRQCGTCTETEAYNISGVDDLLCESCFSQISAAADRDRQTLDRKSENYLAGAVGALLGSLIGAIAIILISRLGFVAAISGVLMAVCAIKGYELLGGKFSLLDACICIALIIGMTYLADRIDWAISIYKELHTYYPDVSFFDYFRSVHALLGEADLNREYIGNLLILYLFTLLGGIPTVISSLKKNALVGRTSRLSAENESSEPLL